MDQDGQRLRSVKHTIKWLDFRQTCLPPLVLPINLTKICHEKCLLGIRLVGVREARSIHDAHPHMDLGMTKEKGRKRWENTNPRVNARV